jgi:hypothetical protein
VKLNKKAKKISKKQAIQVYAKFNYDLGCFDLIDKAADVLERSVVSGKRVGKFYIIKWFDDSDWGTGYTIFKNSREKACIPQRASENNPVDLEGSLIKDRPSLRVLKKVLGWNIKRTVIRNQTITVTKIDDSKWYKLIYGLTGSGKKVYLTEHFSVPALQIGEKVKCTLVKLASGKLLATSIKRIKKV